MRLNSYERAWVLHTRAWRETSLLVELFTLEAGRVGVIARGARRPQRGGRVLEPFVAVCCQLSGRGELRTFGNHECVQRLALGGAALYSGFYLNELLMRLLQREDAHKGLFVAYEEVLSLLGDLPKGMAMIALEPALRRFEFKLLDEIGFGLSLTEDLTGASVDPSRLYTLRPPGGLMPVAGDDARQETEGEPWISGSDLLAIADGRMNSLSVLRAAKRLSRAALAPHLGPRALYSRALFACREKKMLSATDIQ